MKPVHVFLILCALVTPVSLAGYADVVGPPTIITMKALSYDPEMLELRVGDSVLWKNASHTQHTATSDDDGKTFDTSEIAPGTSSKPLAFQKEGEYSYHCKIHGKTMSGTIIVKAAR